MTDHQPGPTQRPVDEHVPRWRSTRPVIAISRQHGAGGELVARRLAEGLELELFDREIIDRIAANAHRSARVVRAVDERERKMLADCLAALAPDEYLSANAYREHLTQVVLGIGERGGAVILGRGAHLILGPSRALCILVGAPLALRVAEVARAEGLSERAARLRVAGVEAERRAFILRHFHADPADLSVFDLAVNTGTLGIDGAVAAVRSTVERLQERRPAARAG